MLSYELANELKKAGFPQMGDGYALILDPRPHIVEDEHDRPVTSLPWNIYVFRSDLGNKTIYCPTLSELIETCGEGLRMLRRSGETPGWWKANNGLIGTKIIEAEGSTLEEAVARLWLGLKKA